jgi:hypothetical protein
VRLAGLGLRRRASFASYSGEAMVARSLASLAAFFSGSLRAADILACTSGERKAASLFVWILGDVFNFLCCLVVDYLG